MLTDLTVVEQRHKAVVEVVEHNAKVTDVAMRFGVERRTLQRWIAHYEQRGMAALANRSSKPAHCPHQMQAEIEARIVELRRAHPDWGSRTIRNKLRKVLDDVPSRAAIHRCLVRNRLIDHKSRKRRRQDYKRWDHSRAMELCRSTS